MNTKLTSPGQVALLKEGDIIKQYPRNCADGPQDTFNENRPKHIGTYEIRRINHTTGVFLLVSANFRTLVLASPTDIERQYIKAANLISEKVWWLNS